MWDAFVEASPQGSIFSTTKWLNLYEEPYKIWGWYKGDELLGGVIDWEPHPLIPFQGIICKKVDKYTTQMSLENEVSNGLMDVCPNEFFNNYNFTDIRPFLWRGWKPIIRYTYLLDMNDDTWDNLEKQTRYEINNTKLETGFSTDDFNDLYDITFARKGLKRPVGREFIEEIRSTIPNIMFVFYDNKKPSSGAMMIQDSKRWYYILGASTGENTSAYALWKAFPMVGEVDLVGCNDEKIGKFKKGFGGKLTPYYGLKRANV